MVIYNAYDKEAVASFPTREEAIKWMTDRAAEWNYGIYRTWTIDGLEYYDVGPRVYCILAQ